MCLRGGVAVKEITNRIVSTYGHVSLWSNTRETEMKILGIGICFAIMLGAILQIGHHLFIDINSALFVLGEQQGFWSLRKIQAITSKTLVRALFILAG